MGGRGAGKLSLDWKLAKVSCPLFQQLKTPSSKRPAKGQWVRIDSFVLSVAVVAVVHVAAIFCVVIVFLFLVFNELSVNIRSCAVDWFMSLASVLLLCAAAFFIALVYALSPTASLGANQSKRSATSHVVLLLYKRMLELRSECRWDRSEANSVLLHASVL